MKRPRLVFLITFSVLAPLLAYAASAAAAMSGTLTPASPSCTIAAGASTCNVSLTWSTTNPVNTSAVTSSWPSANTPVATGNSGSTTAPVPYNSRTFYLYNTAQLLATSSATASCASGTTWNGSTCQAPITTGTLNVTTTPVNGDIFVDGTWRGNRSISIQLAAGSYTVSFVDVSGYTPPAPQPVSIAANETKIMSVEYVLISLGKVNLLSPSNDDATGVSITPTFSWDWVSGANQYWLMVASNPSDFLADPVATSCPNCIISGFTDEPGYRSPYNFRFAGGRSKTLSVNTVYYWRVQARNSNGARGDYSDIFRFTTEEGPESNPAKRLWIVNPRNTPTLGGRAVVITHGWNSDASSWVSEMAAAICRKLNKNREWDGTLSAIKENDATIVCQVNDWDVWVYDWRDLAEFWKGWDLVGGGLRFPPYAKTNAGKLGVPLANALNKGDYQHIHFIAHSAGANLIEQASYWMKKFRPTRTIHETFLDPYDDEMEFSKYGDQADWAENYVE